ncbi:hypothetical protein A2U01_0008393 [Trifolium medium]|uniref:Uncharacterized protein n=1 Tax=Trifolium medium TaxID=97028 RepID=A0A392MJ43_9FABA|nr:hypothetical protein [Trifolium medium]
MASNSLNEVNNSISRLIDVLKIETAKAKKLQGKKKDGKKDPKDLEKELKKVNENISKAGASLKSLKEQKEKIEQKKGS